MKRLALMLATFGVAACSATTGSGPVPAPDAGAAGFVAPDVHEVFPDRRRKPKPTPSPTPTPTPEPTPVPTPTPAGTLAYTLGTTCGVGSCSASVSLDGTVVGTAGYTAGIGTYSNTSFTGTVTFLGTTYGDFAGTFTETGSNTWILQGTFDQGFSTLTETFYVFGHSGRGGGTTVQNLSGSVVTPLVTPSPTPVPTPVPTPRHTPSDS